MTGEAKLACLILFAFGLVLIASLLFVPKATTDRPVVSVALARGLTGIASVGLSLGMILISGG